MNFLTAEQCASWAAARAFPVTGTPPSLSLEAAGYRSIDFQIPSDAGRRIALARMLWEAGGADRPESLLWVTQWSVWPSGEHLPLAVTLRSAFGEQRPLHERPGHLFGPGEDEAAISFLAVALLFLWDAYLLIGSGELAIFVSHDEYGIALARTPDAWLPLEQRLAKLRGPAA